MTAVAPGMPAFRSEEPLKRKRGRPPKANKLGEPFPTLTLQFHPSPPSASGGPTAELNSSMTVKMGEPDTFTPLMKVLPASHLAKRRRRRRSSNESPLRGKSTGGIPTPMSSVASHRRPSHHLDPRAVDKIFSLTSPELELRPPWLQLPPQTRGAAGLEGLMRFVDDDGFGFQLVVNEVGRAELHGAAQHHSAQSGAAQSGAAQSGAQTGSAAAVAPSDEKHIVPQTPKGDLYPFSREEPGAAPDAGFGLRLTPQFNTMMYSVMSLNSPQQRDPHQLLLGPEIIDSQARVAPDSSSIDTHNLLDTGVHDLLARDHLVRDEGDARYALKKILNF